MFFGFSNDLEKEIKEKDHLIRKLNADIKRMRALSREEKKTLQKELSSSNSRLKSLDSRLNSLASKKEEATTSEVYNATNNMRYFYDAAEIIISLAKRDEARLSFASIYIDNYEDMYGKYSKDRFNHILQAIVHRLATTVRESDVFVKFNDSTFMLLFPETSLAQAKIISEKLKKTVASCKVVDSENFSLSIGLTEYSLKDDNMNLVLERVTKLLETAKKQGNSIKS